MRGFHRRTSDCFSYVALFVNRQQIARCFKNIAHDKNLSALFENVLADLFFIFAGK